MAVRLSVLRAGRPLPAGRFLVLISVRGWVDSRAIMILEELGQLKNSNDHIGTRTCDLPACGIISQPTTLSCWTLAVIVLNILSDERTGLSLMNMLALSSSVRIAHIACYWKFFLLHYIQVFCQSRLCKAEHTYLMHLMLQRQLSYLNGRKLDHRQV
jgi:hypothetical protein